MQPDLTTKTTALYERLSRDDELIGDSNSIINQKQMLETYASQHGFSNCVHYTDDGYSGGNFDRPGWKQLVSDIEAGRVAAVIAKDMSRIGRDYLQTGFYTEVLFREKGIRFIAIGNGVDSTDGTTSEFAPFLNIMNEWYLRDASRKQIASYRARSQAGKPTANHALYGFRKDPADKHKRLIDDEAADVVRRIFRMSIDGLGPYRIARILREEGVERPSAYLAARGCGTHQSDADPDRQYDWCSATVSQILARPEYMGHTVNFRSQKLSYKDRQTVRRPKEEWAVLENTHEPIVSAEIWQLAQHVRRAVHRIGRGDDTLAALLVCADCGGGFYHHAGKPRPDLPDNGRDPLTGGFPYDHYECATYAKTGSYSDRRCCSHYVNTKKLHIEVMRILREVCRYASQNEAAFVRQVRTSAEIRRANSAKQLEKQLEKHAARAQELDELARRAYESYAHGLLTEKRYLRLMNTYEQEQTATEAAAEGVRAQLAQFSIDNDRIQAFLVLAHRYAAAEALTAPMLCALAEKIIVHAPSHEKGHRSQKIEVVFCHIGHFDPPPVPIRRRKKTVGIA